MPWQVQPVGKYVAQPGHLLGHRQPRQVVPGQPQRQRQVAQPLDQGIVASLANRTATIILLEPLGQEEEAEYGMANPSAVVTIRTHSEEEGDQTYTLWVGARDPADNSYVIRSSESAYYVRVSEYSVQDLVEYTREDLMELPHTPAPEATPESP